MNDDAKLPNPTAQKFVPVCAIGASAGGVVALQNLFRQLPNDLGLAYVVILHLSPDHPSALSEILGGCTRMPVLQIDDGPTLKADCVYVIPPDRELVIQGDSVAARPFSEPRGQRAPIDMFFRSVAAARGDGIAVVLSGAGADGANGARAIKEGGGVIMVQEPAEAGFASMPQNAIATGVADFVAPLARLAERLAEVAHSKEAVRSLDMDGSANDLRRIVAFVRARTGHDFSGYKRATVMRRVIRRMQVCRTDTLADYADYLLTTPEEARELFADLLISVTMFFRDAHAFEALERHAIKAIFDDLDPEKEEGVRAWVVGCATGEEAYGVAILLHEEATRRKLYPQIQVFASDLDEGALATAREGRYPRSIEADVSDERLARFFLDEGTHYRVRKELRESVLFATHSVIKEPPFMRLDLITCRNLLIYLERSLQQQLCSIFHYGLKPGRYLFLGSAETADVAADLFAPLDRETRIYCARPQVANALPILPQFAVPERLLPADQSTRARVEPADLPTVLHASALERVAPASALVDDMQNILHISPSAGRFILHSAGPISNLLPAVVRPELRLDLRLALGRALDQRQPTLTHPTVVAFEGERRRIAMHVAPVPDEAHVGARALVFFLDAGPADGEDSEVQPDTRPDEVRRLHAELKAAQEALVASRSGHEVSIQDLRATNEELQSINEEYRSTAEELETSKEELQSMNEELHTVNAELKSKLASISVAHSDLQNLTAATEIGTLFLDTDLRIRMFTAPIAELFNVTKADIGRTITDFTNRLDYDRIAEDARRVLADLNLIERVVRSRDGQWYVMRVRPYRTVDDRIDGTVVTFVDTTARLRAEAALARSEQQLRALLQASSQVLYRMSPGWDAMRALTGGGFLTDTDGPDEAWLANYIPDEEQARVRAEIRAAAEAKRMFDLEHRVRRLDGTIGWMHSRAIPILDEAGSITEWFGSASDVTQRKRAEDALRESEERYRLILESVRDYAIFTTDTQGLIRAWPPGAQAVFGWSAEEALGQDVAMTYVPEDREAGAPEEERIQALETGHAANVRWHLRKDGTRVFIEGSMRPLRTISDSPRGFLKVGQDVTERRRAEAQLSESRRRLTALIDGIPQLVWRGVDGGEWTWSSPQWQAYTGQTEAESRGRGWLEPIHPDDRETALAAWREAEASGSLAFEHRLYNRDARRYRWFQTRATPVRDEHGGIVEWLGTSTDIDDLREMQERQSILVAELQHRTRNLLGVVRSIAQQTMAQTGPGERFHDQFNDRLTALSRVQGLLSRSDEEPITIGALIQTELDALGAGGLQERIRLDGPAVRLRKATVQTFALALHELATNALKYGALTTDEGRLSVTWRTYEADGGKPRLLVEWLEEGLVRSREEQSPVTRGGYGRELIERALPYVLKARTSYELGETELRCSIDLPLTEATREG